MTHPLLAEFTARELDMLDALEELVRIESPTNDVSAVERCASALECQLRAQLTRPRITLLGDPAHIRVDLGDRSDVLLLGHFDTVHPIGTLKAHGIRRDGDRLYGPGTMDMKAGVVVMIEVARYLQRMHEHPNVTLFFSNDEEVCSPRSGPFLRDLAAHAEVGLIFEGVSEPDVVKIGNKGVRQIRITVHGKGAHAAYPESYNNPVPLLSRYITSIESRFGGRADISVTPTMLQSSAAPNVVADDASVVLDVRSSDNSLLDETVAQLVAFDEEVEGAVFSSEVLVATRAFPTDPENNRALAYLDRASSELGLPSYAAIEGRGGSDANQICHILPHLVEGLGGWGGGAHVPDKEYISVSSLPTSAALAARSVELALDLAGVMRPSTTKSTVIS